MWRSTAGKDISLAASLSLLPHKRFMAGFDNDGDLLAYGETLPVS
jgi:hypothetical protein